MLQTREAADASFHKLTFCITHRSSFMASDKADSSLFCWPFAPRLLCSIVLQYTILSLNFHISCNIRLWQNHIPHSVKTADKLVHPLCNYTTNFSFSPYETPSLVQSRQKKLTCSTNLIWHRHPSQLVSIRQTSTLIQISVLISLTFNSAV